ncbi:hypothetical protein L0244_27380 [bacterium]|nr:hypothetical protein [bacterium]
MSDDLQIVADKNANDPQALFGVFDATRVPQLDFRSFQNIKNIHAAVSPDCSYRLVRDAVNTAQSTLDLYIYNVSADHLLDLLRDARDREVSICIMYDVMDARGCEKNKKRKAHATKRVW